MKTIIYDATILTSAANKNSNRSGIFFTAYNIALELNNNKNVKLMFYCDPGSVGALKDAIKKCMPEFLNVRFHNLQGSFKPGTCFLSPVFKAPDAISKNSSVQKYTILYDTIPYLFPEYFGITAKRGEETHWLAQLVKQIKNSPNDKYFAISEATKRDFLKLIPSLRPEQVIVAPLASSDNFYQGTRKQTVAALKKYNLPTDKKYVFSLCSLEPRKNLIRAVKTFIEFIKKNKIDDIVFVLGGAHWDAFIGKLESEIKDLGKYKDKIIRAGYIDDEDLAPLYSGAEWFVYTSQYEGFGLPPLEAMQCGCPVITSNNSSLPEVVGNAAQMIDWDSDAQHIAAYKKYYFDEKYRKSMAKEGLKQSQCFSWKKPQI